MLSPPSSFGCVFVVRWTLALLHIQRTACSMSFFRVLEFCLILRWSYRWVHQLYIYIYIYIYVYIRVARDRGSGAKMLFELFSIAKIRETYSASHLMWHALRKSSADYSVLWKRVPTIILPMR